MIFIKNLQRLSPLKYKQKQHRASFLNSVCFNRLSDDNTLVVHTGFDLGLKTSFAR